MPTPGLTLGASISEEMAHIITVLAPQCRIEGGDGAVQHLRPAEQEPGQRARGVPCPDGQCTVGFVVVFHPGAQQALRHRSVRPYYMNIQTFVAHSHLELQDKKDVISCCGLFGQVHGRMCKYSGLMLWHHGSFLHQSGHGEAVWELVPTNNCEVSHHHLRKPPHYVVQLGSGM